MISLPSFDPRINVSFDPAYTVRAHLYSLREQTSALHAP